MNYDISKLKSFDLERSKAGDPVVYVIPGKKVSPARIICFDRKTDNANEILALVEERNVECNVYFHLNGESTDDDGIKLMMAPKTVTKFGGVCKNINGDYCTFTPLFDTEQEAIDYLGCLVKVSCNDSNRVSKVEWEE